MNVGHREMRHLVHGLPIVGEFGLGYVAADQQPDRRAAITVARAALHLAAGDRDDQDAR